MHLFLCKFYGDYRLNDEVSDRLLYSFDKRTIKEKQNKTKNKNKNKKQRNKQNFTFHCFKETGSNLELICRVYSFTSMILCDP